MDIYKCTKCGYVCTEDEIGVETYVDHVEYWGQSVPMESRESYCPHCGAESFYIEEVSVPYDQDFFEDNEWHMCYDCPGDCLECIEANVFDECTQDEKLTLKELREILIEDMEMDDEQLAHYYEQFSVEEQFGTKSA